MGTWKRLAGAFVDFDGSEKEAVPDGDIDLDSIGDVSDLLDSLGVTDDKAAATIIDVNAATLPGISKDKPFNEIYSDQGVPSSPKSAEEVLAILGGMSTLPPEVRAISLDAMDKADDEWTMDDVRLDAKNKQGALAIYKTGLNTALSQAEAAKESSLTDTDAYVSNATETIRDNIENLQEEIAACQTLLQEELVSATEEKALIKSDYEAVVSVHASECARVDVEIERLKTV